MRYLLVVLGVLVALAVWGSIAGQRAQLRAVTTIQPDSRGQLYGRSLENLRFCKAHSNEGFDRFCSGEAEFVVAFPECDRECEELARRFLSRPAR